MPSRRPVKCPNCGLVTTPVSGFCRNCLESLPLTPAGVPLALLVPTALIVLALLGGGAALIAGARPDLVRPEVQPRSAQPAAPTPEPTSAAATSPSPTVAPPSPSAIASPTTMPQTAQPTTVPDASATPRAVPRMPDTSTERAATR